MISHPSLRSDYGEKRDYPKIDIYVRGKYSGTTTWSKNLKEAIMAYRISHQDIAHDEIQDGKYLIDAQYQ